MSETNRIQYGYGIETAIGVPPVTAFQEFLVESDSFAFHETSRPSTTMRSDGQVQKNVRLNIDPNGDIPFNFSFQVLDDFLTGILNSGAWPADLLINANIAAASPANTFTGAAATFANVQVGQWVKTSGFTNPANNGYMKVIAKAGDSSSITVAQTLVTEAGAVGRKVNGSAIFNARNLMSFAWEKGFLDTTGPVYDSWKGMRMSKLGLTMTTGEPIKGTMSFAGIGAALTAGAAKISPAGLYTPAPAFDEINSNDNIMAIYQNNSMITQDCTELQLNLNSALRAKGRLMKLGPFDRGVGRFTVDAMLNVYFADRVLLDLARGYSQIGVAWRFSDAAGNGYIFDLMRGRISQGDPTNPGLDQDVISKFKIEAELDAAISGKMFCVSRFLATD